MVIVNNTIFCHLCPVMRKSELQEWKRMKFSAKQINASHLFVSIKIDVICCCVFLSLVAMTNGNFSQDGHIGILFDHEEYNIFFFAFLWVCVVWVYNVIWSECIQVSFMGGQFCSALQCYLLLQNLTFFCKWNLEDMCSSTSKALKDFKISWSWRQIWRCHSIL